MRDSSRADPGGPCSLLDFSTAIVDLSRAERRIAMSTSNERITRCFLALTE